MAEKIIGVYKITNTITGDFYVGSSKDVKKRWAHHKCLSTWKHYPNNQMYQDFQRYGVNKFGFEILEEVEIAHLKEKEQQFIETLKPTYNNYNAKGFDVWRWKEYVKEYNKEYYNQLCCYNNETITLCALSTRFKRAGIEHPVKEAKKYILTNYKVK